MTAERQTECGEGKAVGVVTVFSASLHSISSLLVSIRPWGHGACPLGTPRTGNKFLHLKKGNRLFLLLQEFTDTNFKNENKYVKVKICYLLCFTISSLSFSVLLYFVNAMHEAPFPRCCSLKNFLIVIYF